MHRMPFTQPARLSIFLSTILSCCLAACGGDINELEAQDFDGAAQTGVLSRTLAAGNAFTFVNEKSGRCMGVDRASKLAGALVQQFDCPPTRAPNQTWIVGGNVSIAGFRPLVNKKSDMCLGVDGGGTTHGANLMQFPCDPRPNQQWKYEERPDSTFRFRNANGLCMGVDGASKANGAQLKQFRCDEALNQRWSVR
jgi:hypothetical protein